RSDSRVFLGWWNFGGVEQRDHAERERGDCRAAAPGAIHAAPVFCRRRRADARAKPAVPGSAAGRAHTPRDRHRRGGDGFSDAPSWIELGRALLSQRWRRGGRHRPHDWSRAAVVLAGDHGSCYSALKGAQMTRTAWMWIWLAVMLGSSALVHAADENL